MQLTDFVHFVNPNQQKRRLVERYFRERPELRSVFLERTSHPTHLETVAEWALNEGHRHVAVWGGDGTLHRVIQKFYEMNALGKMTFTLIPVGTCNDFARALKIPVWRQYLSLMQTEPAQEMTADVGLVSYASDHGTRRCVFVNNAGFGRAPEALTQKRSNPIRDIFSFRLKPIDLDWVWNKSHSFEHRNMLLGVVCNGPYFSKGLHFDTRASISDGMLNAYFEGPQSRAHLLWSFVKARFGRPLRSVSTFHVPASEISVQSSQLLYPQADGEPVESQGVNRLVFSILPQALRLVRWG